MKKIKVVPTLLRSPGARQRPTTRDALAKVGRQPRKKEAASVATRALRFPMRPIDPNSTGKNGAGLRAAPVESRHDLEGAHGCGARWSGHNDAPVVQIRDRARSRAEGEIR